MTDTPVLAAPHKAVDPLPTVWDPNSRVGEMLRCPWHGWEFDVRTGQSWFDPVQVRVRRYNVTVTPGSALVGANGAEQIAEGAALGTYNAAATRAP